MMEHFVSIFLVASLETLSNAHRDGVCGAPRRGVCVQSRNDVNAQRSLSQAHPSLLRHVPETQTKTSTGSTATGLATRPCSRLPLSRSPTRPSPSPSCASPPALARQVRYETHYRCVHGARERSLEYVPCSIGSLCARIAFDAGTHDLNAYPAHTSLVPRAQYTSAFIARSLMRTHVLLNHIILHRHRPHCRVHNSYTSGRRGSCTSPLTRAHKDLNATSTHISFHALPAFLLLIPHHACPSFNPIFHTQAPAPSPPTQLAHRKAARSCISPLTRAHTTSTHPAPTSSTPSPP